MNISLILTILSALASGILSVLIVVADKSTAKKKHQKRKLYFLLLGMSVFALVISLLLPFMEKREAYLAQQEHYEQQCDYYWQTEQYIKAAEQYNLLSQHTKSKDKCFYAIYREANCYSSYGKQQNDKKYTLRSIELLETLLKHTDYSQSRDYLMASMSLCTQYLGEDDDKYNTSIQALIDFFYSVPADDIFSDPDENTDFRMMRAFNAAWNCQQQYFRNASITMLEEYKVYAQEAISISEEYTENAWSSDSDYDLLKNGLLCDLADSTVLLATMQKGNDLNLFHTAIKMYSQMSPDKAYELGMAYAIDKDYGMAFSYSQLSIYSQVNKRENAWMSYCIAKPNISESVVSLDLEMMRFGTIAIISGYCTDDDIKLIFERYDRLLSTYSFYSDPQSYIKVKSDMLFNSTLLATTTKHNQPEMYKTATELLNEFETRLLPVMETEGIYSHEILRIETCKALLEKAESYYSS